MTTMEECPYCRQNLYNESQVEKLSNKIKYIVEQLRGGSG